MGGRRSVWEEQVEAVWNVELSWPGAGLAGDPPPKTSARRPATAAAASCTGVGSVPIRRTAPVAVLTA
jgi:hypothetical protein